MTPSVLDRHIVQPALELVREVAPRIVPSPAARRMMLAIALQETGLRHRVQVGGPARGLWQFEQGGGVAGVLRHRATAEPAAAICRTLLVPAEPVAVYAALAQNDLLAASFARLLLWSDPQALPADPETGWATYMRTWRPGKPHPLTWAGFWRTADAAAR